MAMSLARKCVDIFRSADQFWKEDLEYTLWGLALPIWKCLVLRIELSRQAKGIP